MKKEIFALFLMILSMLCGSFGISAEETAPSPVGVEQLQEGTYPITVETDSSMFRVTACSLTVSEGKMTAVLTLSGTGYGKLFLGTAEEASQADEASFIPYEEKDGAYTYTVPVSALNQEIACAAWSTRKETWYDRKLVFSAESLPQEAFAAKKSRFPMWCVFLVIFLVVALLAGIAMIKSHGPKEESASAPEPDTAKPESGEKPHDS